MPARIVVAELRARGLSFEVLLNGALCYRERAAEPASHMAKLNPWVIGGENVFAIAVASPAGEVPEGAPPAALSLRVRQGLHGEEPGPEGVLLEWTWSPTALGPAPLVALERGLRFAGDPGRWAWQDATPYAPADRPDVEKLVGDVHAAFQARDLAALAELYRLSDEELDRALDLPAGFQAVARSAMWLELFEKPDYAVDPLDLADLELVPRAGGRLVEPRLPDGSGPVRARAGGELLEVGLAMCRLPPGYQVAR